MMGSCKHLLSICLNLNKLKKGNYVKLKWVTKKKKVNREMQKWLGHLL